jgi:hypothetical protein
VALPVLTTDGVFTYPIGGFFIPDGGFVWFLTAVRFSNH